MSKFLDLNGLDYFWDKIVARINSASTALGNQITALGTSIDGKADKVHTILGNNNVDDPNNAYLLMVGNGADSSHKNTVFSIDNGGDVSIENDLQVDGSTNMDGGLTMNTVDVSLKSSNIDRDGSNPSSQAIGNSEITFIDKDGDRVARVYTVRETSGKQRVSLSVLNDNGGTEVSNILSMLIAKDGAKSYEVSDPVAFCSAIGVGDFVSNDISTNVTVASAADTSIGSVSLEAGVWVISYGAKFPINSTGVRSIALNTSPSSPTDYYYRRTCLQTNAVSGSNYNTWLHSAAVMSFSSATTIHLIVAQNSGSNKSVQGCISAVKIK